MAKLIVDKNACIGCGVCVATDIEHFEFDDSGLSEVISQENLQSVQLASAINFCPTDAIKLAEEDNEEDEVMDINTTTEPVCACEICNCDPCECTEKCTCENSLECEA